MAGEHTPGVPRSLNAADAFEMFMWLQGPYAEVAAATDFLSLSSFEQWERLRQYVDKVGYLLGRKNLSSLDEVTNQSKAKLLQWLEENRLRNPAPEAAPAALPSHKLLQSKLLR